jgi:SAM-dependent methyltransferase
MLEFLTAYGAPVGVDRSLDAIAFARTRCAAPLVAGDIRQIPLRAASADLVTAFDVLEHADDDLAALRELGRVCRPGGHVLVTVPAFPFLWGNQDVVSHHRRRYRRRQLEARVVQAGLHVVTLTYFNTLLFPVVAAVRLARRLVPARGAPRSDFAMQVPGAMNAALAGILGAEGRLVGRWRLPFGVSLLCLAERKGTPRA